MKRIPKYIAVAALSLGVSSLFAQDDVYYNPNSNKGTTQPVQTDYQKQYETTTPEPTPASNASNYDYKRDGYSTPDASQYSSTKNGSNNQVSDSYYEDDYYFDDFSYSGRLNRFYQPHRGLGYWNNFYDPFYWSTPTIIIQTSYYNPWWSNWRYNICNLQPWRCQLYSYGGSWGGGWNTGWGGGWNYGYGGGWGGGWNNGWGGNPYWNGYQAGYYNGYYNAGYNNGYYNGYYNGGYNNGYGDYNQQHNYSYYGPRKQSGAAGGNTTDGQIKRAEGRAGKTDETDIPREGLVKPIGGRATGTSTPIQQSTPTRPVGVDNPVRIENAGEASPGKLNPSTPTRPAPIDLRPQPSQPRQVEQPSAPRQFETRPQPAAPRQIETETRPSNSIQMETRPQPSKPTQPRQMESSPQPSTPRQIESRPQPSQPRQMESRPPTRQFESSPTPNRGFDNGGGGNYSAPRPSNGGGRSPGRVR